MARFRKIDPRIWCDSKFASLDIHAQRLFIYILTCPEMSVVGAMRNSALTIAQSLGYLEAFGEALPKALPEAFSKAFSQLKEKALIKVDERALLVFVPNFLKYNEPESPNVVAGWASAIEYLPECPLLLEVVEKAIFYGKAKFPNNINATAKLERLYSSLLEAFGKDLGKPYIKPLGKPSVKASSKPSGKPSPQEQEQEHIYTPIPPEGANPASEVSTPAKGERKKNPDAVAEAQRPDEVTEEAWAAWMQVRKDKNAKHFSVYAFNLFKAECEKAGITLQQAVETCIAHHWASYRVEYQTNATNRNTGRFERSDEDNPFLVKNLKPRKQDDGEFDPEVMAALRKGMKG